MEFDMNQKIIPATPFGSVAILWTAMDGRATIIRVLLSMPGLFAQERAHEYYTHPQTTSCEELEEFATGIAGILEGEEMALSLDRVDLGQCSEFQRRVLQVVHEIPRGCVSTYRLIAGHLGKTNGARAVGGALASNPFPLIVPCHRAIRSDGSLGGYQGGPDMKRALLEKEGVGF